MVITLPNRAAIIQRRENCSRAEPQNNSLTGTSPTRDALVSDEYASRAYGPLSTHNSRSLRLTRSAGVAPFETLAVETAGFGLLGILFSCAGRGFKQFKERKAAVG